MRKLKPSKSKWFTSQLQKQHITGVHSCIVSNQWAGYVLVYSQILRRLWDDFHKHPGKMLKSKTEHHFKALRWTQKRKRDSWQELKLESGANWERELQGLFSGPEKNQHWISFLKEITQKQEEILTKTISEGQSGTKREVKERWNLQTWAISTPQFSVCKVVLDDRSRKESFRASSMTFERSSDLLLCEHWKESLPILDS